MNAGFRRNGIGCLEVYQASLERRIQQGEWDLVSRDEELCKEIETRLTECSPQNFNLQLGLDPLSVMEASLRASHHTSCQNRLRSLIKAFEVLELAALNLYLCPWRKEYKVVKMFSGMFTHYVKPALTAQQAKELFALLGYQPAGSDEQELRLSVKPVHSHTLLQLACGFFTARIECQLLLTAVASVGGNMEWVLQLIHERRHSCTFQKALDSAKRKLDPVSCDSPLALDATLDLYTDDSLAEHSHMASPPNLSYIPPTEDPFPQKISCSTTSQSNKERNEKKGQTVSISSLTCHINATPQKTDSSLKPCENERQITRRCEQGPESIFAQQHMIDSLPQARQSQIQHWEKPPKDNLKQHSCINKPSNDFFYVCHDCHYIHDMKCEEFKRCFVSHNVQNTGRIQPAQIESGMTAHTCFKVEDIEYVICHTCNKSYDIMCNELEGCQMSDHKLAYLFENNKKTTQPKPMPLHKCCTSIPPKFVCLTCKVFHAISCDDNQCQRKHEVQSLRYMCCMCLQTEIYILCRYCCAQYCIKCWLKKPLECKCGMPFEMSSV